MITNAHAESTDEMLVVRYRRGDRTAFAELVRRYQTPLFNFSLRYLRDAERAKDVTQETFVRLVKRAAEFKHESRFSTWLYTITRNLCIDELRRGQLRNHSSLDGDLAGESPLHERLGDSNSNPERSASSGRARQTIIRAIESLPTEQREVFLLRQWGGIPFSEIARMTDSSENTVKSRMRYALTKLQAELAEFEEFARALR